MIWAALLAACTGTTPGTDDSTPVVDSSDPGCTTVGLAVGQCAPDFTLPDAQGVPWTRSDHAGDVIVVEISGFW